MLTALRLLSAAFTAGERATDYDPGTKIRILRDGSPEWMTDLIHEAHGDMMPDDMRYRMIEEVVDALIERGCDSEEEANDARGEIADELVDVYNSARLRWLGSHHSRADYCDQAQSDGLCSADASMFDRIGVGQYMEYDEIAGLIAGFDYSEIGEEV
jgi:hypothetical protein